MTCKDCVHYDVCFKTRSDEMEWCEHFKDKSKFIELPFIAMIEQFIKNGKFDKRNTTHNGKYAVVYIDKSKWGTPLIDVTSKYYNAEEAEKALEGMRNGL